MTFDARLPPFVHSAVEAGPSPLMKRFFKVA